VSEWESRRIEQLLSRQEVTLEQQTRLLERIACLELKQVALLEQLVASQQPVTYPAPLAIAVSVK